MSNDRTLGASWTEFDQKRAVSEGWLITNASDGRLEIQRSDEAGAFSNDATAIAHVYWRALEGSPLHRKALDYTTTRSEPKNDEYLVAWEIELSATSPEAAAEMAEAIMKDEFRVGKVFRVQIGEDGLSALVKVKDGVGQQIVGEGR